MAKGRHDLAAGQMRRLRYIRARDTGSREICEMSIQFVSATKGRQQRLRRDRAGFSPAGRGRCGGDRAWKHKMPGQRRWRLAIYCGYARTGSYSQKKRRRRDHFPLPGSRRRRPRTRRRNLPTPPELMKLPCMRGGLFCRHPPVRPHPRERCSFRARADAVSLKRVSARHPVKTACLRSGSACRSANSDRLARRGASLIGRSAPFRTPSRAKETRKCCPATGRCSAWPLTRLAPEGVVCRFTTLVLESPGQGPNPDLPRRPVAPDGTMFREEEPPSRRQAAVRPQHGLVSAGRSAPSIKDVAFKDIASRRGPAVQGADTPLGMRTPLTRLRIPADDSAIRSGNPAQGPAAGMSASQRRRLRRIYMHRNIRSN